MFFINDLSSVSSGFGEFSRMSKFFWVEIWPKFSAHLFGASDPLGRRSSLVERTRSEHLWDGSRKAFDWKEKLKKAWKFEHGETTSNYLDLEDRNLRNGYNLYHKFKADFIWQLSWSFFSDRSQKKTIKTPLSELKEADDLGKQRLRDRALPLGSLAYL